jgi:hypothetical protein
LLSTSPGMLGLDCFDPPVCFEGAACVDGAD